MKRQLFPALLAGAAISVLCGCGGGGGGGGQNPSGNGVTVAVAPQTANVTTGGTQGFTATVNGSSDTAVTWSLTEGAAGGTFTPGSNGTVQYTAPATAGTYHLVATSHADNSKSGSATITVTAPSSGVSITVAPTSATVSVGNSQTFTATVTGTTNTAVNWTVQEGAAGGTVTNGTYTAPNTPGVYHVVATSAADAGKSVSIPVTVTANPAISVSVAPPTSTVVGGTVVNLTAHVFGTSITGVTWAADGGTLLTTGANTAAFTAPGTLGTYHVVVTSTADTSKTATATITVSTTPAGEITVQ